MAIRYPQILTRSAPPQFWSWTERDFIQYALCLGMGREATDPRTLPFVYERDLKIVPTMPTVIAWIAEPTFTQLGVDPITALHGEQKIELHRVLSCPLSVKVRAQVVAVCDKGADRGALVTTQHEILDAGDDQRIATLTTTCFARSEGGCGGDNSASPVPHPMPKRPPYRSVEYPTSPDLALWYRLTGDRNPVHADPKVASQAGYCRPILHGLCSFGITCRAVLETFAAFEPEQILSHQARFSAPVFPGDVLTVDLWRDGEVVSFEARVKQRSVTVIKHGKAVLRRS